MCTSLTRSPSQLFDAERRVADLERNSQTLSTELALARREIEVYKVSPLTDQSSFLNRWMWITLVATLVSIRNENRKLRLAIPGDSLVSGRREGNCSPSDEDSYWKG